MDEHVEPRAEKRIEELKRVSDLIISAFHETAITKGERIRKVRQGLTEIKQFRRDYPEMKAGAEVERIVENYLRNEDLWEEAKRECELGYEILGRSAVGDFESAEECFEAAVNKLDELTAIDIPTVPPQGGSKSAAWNPRC